MPLLDYMLAKIKNGDPEEIIKFLRKQDNLYYNGHEPEISDYEYDTIKTAAQEKFPRNSYFNEVGAPPQDSKSKIELPFILGSLHKKKFDGTTNKWASGLNDSYIVASEKLDGMSFYAEYVDGKPELVATRGNGYEGENITNKASKILPDLSQASTVKLRGEFIMKGEAYKELGYKNRRNAVAGIVNRDDHTNIEYLTPVFYEHIDSDIDSEIERLEYLSSELGLSIPRYRVIKNQSNIEEKLVEVMNEMKENIDYDIDGIVLAANNSQRENVYYPKNKVSFKVNEDAVTAEVLYVDLNTTRTGKVNPKIVINPMEIGGSTVTQANAFNAEYVKDKGIGPGAKVGLVKSGDIIPYITDIFEETNKDKVLPDVCPSCGSPLEWESVDLMCYNDICPAKGVKAIEHFLKMAGAENVNEKTLKKLKIKNIYDLFSLDEFEISMIEGMGLKSGEQIVNEINKCLTPKPEGLLAAFGVPKIGKENARKIMEICNKFEDVFELTEKDLVSIPGIGSKIAETFVKLVQSKKELYNFLVEQGLEIQYSQDQSLKGMIFTLTGKCDIKRELLVKEIEEKGGQVKGMAKSTTYLVTDDFSRESSKMKKAREYDIPIINYEELKGMLGIKE